MSEARNFPNWISSYLDYTDNSEAPKVYRTWTAISGIAAALRRKVWLQWHDKIYPNMYIVLVGPAGGRKGTAMNQMTPFLSGLTLPLAAEAITREALIRELKECVETVIMPDGGYSHSSITVFSPELAVFLGRDNLQLLSDMTDWFDCRDKWTYRTKNQGTDVIQGVFVNLLGATTPSILQNSLPQDAIGGGLTSRIIFVYAKGKDKLVPAPFLTPRDLETQALLLQDLSQISEMTGPFRFTPCFFDRWLEWYPEHEKMPPFSEEKFAGYCERKPTHALKLSIIMSAARSNSQEITAQDLNTALGHLQDAEANMQNVYAGYGRRDTAELVNHIINLIASRKRVPKAALVKRFLTELTVRQLDEIIESLVAMKFCTLEFHGSDTYIVIADQPPPPMPSAHSQPTLPVQAPRSQSS